MTPVFCRVKHDPENGTYGDCLRACVAAMLDMEANPEAVPHFAHDGAIADIVFERMRAYLATQGLAPWLTHYDPTETLENVLEILADSGPGVHYMLFGRTAYDGDHVVICRDGKVVHDPAWYSTPLVKGGSQGSWLVVVFARR
jgi:hypothetical protein